MTHSRAHAVKVKAGLQLDVRSWRLLSVCVWMSHVTYEWVMSHMNESCHIWMSHVTCEYVKSKSPIFIRTVCTLWWVMAYSDVWRGSFICVTWLIRMCDMTHSYVWLDLRWLLCVWVDVSCHTYEWVASHIWMSRVTHVDESCHTYGWVMSHIWMSHVTHMNESRQTYE